MLRTKNDNSFFYAACGDGNIPRTKLEIFTSRKNDEANWHRAKACDVLTRKLWPVALLSNELPLDSCITSAVHLWHPSVPWHMVENSCFGEWVAYSFHKQLFPNNFFSYCNSYIHIRRDTNLGNSLFLCQSSHATFSDGPQDHQKYIFEEEDQCQGRMYGKPLNIVPTLFLLL